MGDPADCNSTITASRLESQSANIKSPHRSFLVAPCQNTTSQESSAATESRVPNNLLYLQCNRIRRKRIVPSARKCASSPREEVCRIPLREKARRSGEFDCLRPLTRSKGPAPREPPPGARPGGACTRPGLRPRRPPRKAAEISGLARSNPIYRGLKNRWTRIP